MVAQSPLRCLLNHPVHAHGCAKGGTWTREQGGSMGCAMGRTPGGATGGSIGLTSLLNLRAVQWLVQWVIDSAIQYLIHIGGAAHRAVQ